MEAASLRTVSTEIFTRGWIEQGWIHFVSSDGHNINNRVPKLHAAFQAVKELFGEEKAEALLVENPFAAFEGRLLPHIPEIADAATPRKHKRFFFF